MKGKIYLVIFFFCLTIFANGQYFQTGQDPSLIKWKQINTPNFQIIYPQEFEKQAQKLTYILEKSYEYGYKTLNYKPKRVSVILHTRTSNSNGLLAWAPKRIELFTTPNQQIYSQDWLQQLGIHEFRHLVQMDKLQSELPILLKTIFGEQAAAAITGIYLPYWFLEGDAVVTETALSNSGRGRTASFSLPYRAQLLEKGIYSYDKAYLGSYKDYVTDYYKLGYWLVGQLRVQYGTDIWIDAIQNIAHRPLSITPLNSTLKSHTGKNINQLYTNLFGHLKEKWEKDLQYRKIDSLTIISPQHKRYTEYLYPQVYHDSIVFAYRTSIDDIGRFVLIYPDKTEKIIFTPGNIYEESVSLTGNMAIWAEKRADVRWTHAEHSVIQILNIETKQRKEIRTENNLFSPVIAPNLKTFAAVESDQEGNYSIGVFDFENGTQIKHFNTSDNQYFITPTWDEKGEKIFFVSLSEKGKCIAYIDLNNNQITELTSRTYANLKKPVLLNKRLYFISDHTGVDNIYSLDLENNIIEQAASVPFGANYINFTKSDNSLLFSNYTSRGYQLAKIREQKRNHPNETIDIQLRTDSLATRLMSQEKGIPTFQNEPTANYPSKKYSKIGHLFNFHSWAPAYIDINNNEIRPGVSLFSQNKLGTAETRLGYDYNTTDRTGKGKLIFKYLGWFPEISFELSDGKEAANYYLIKNTYNKYHQIISSDTTIQRFEWNEFSADIDVRIPLNISRGKYSRIIYPEIKYSLVNISKPDTNLTKLYPSGYQAMTYRLYANNLLHETTQNIMPRWGQQFDIIYRHSPFGQNSLGSQFAMQTAFYIPGFSKNDGFRIYQGYQIKTINSKYSFSNLITFPRGYYGYNNNKMYSITADYKFPLCYPDFSLWKLAYLKRIRTALFYDYAWLSLPKYNESGEIIPNYKNITMRSLGMEVTSDLHILRFFAPIELGLRSVYRPDYGDFQFNLLLSVNFNGF